MTVIYNHNSINKASKRTYPEKGLGSKPGYAGILREGALTTDPTAVTIVKPEIHLDISNNIQV